MKMVNVRCVCLHDDYKPTVCVFTFHVNKDIVKDRFQTPTIFPKYLVLANVRHKYGNGFPSWRNLQLDAFPEINSDVHDYDKGSDISTPALSSFLSRHRPNQHSDAHILEQKATLFGLSDTDIGAVEGEPVEDIFSTAIGVSKDKWATRVITFLIYRADAILYGDGEYLMLKLRGKSTGVSPKWAFQYDKMKGIIREPGLLLVEIPKKRTKFSIPGWHNNENAVLSFIDSMYVCRQASSSVEQEAFADVLGESEERLSPQLRATLIAGLSIISMTGGNQNLTDLIDAILFAAANSLESLLHSEAGDLQVLSGNQCFCQSTCTHRPRSPVAAAKAIGFSIWKVQESALVTRVWDLHQDTLIDNIDVRQVVFVTHRWIVPCENAESQYGEVVYSQVASKEVIEPYGISTKSKKLEDIRNVLLDQGAKYVWMDTICIDKSSLSELDEAIRSMYKWYANCRAVVLDSRTSLRTWIDRGWCLQEGVAAGALYGIYEKKLVSIQVLAKAHNVQLGELDLSAYYRPGNAA
jgi:hypothetical protein